MTSEDSEYRSYLLRLWRERNRRGVVWHASVECIQTAQWHGFGDMEELFEFLRSEAGAVSDSEYGHDNH